jgi:cysteine synthase A
MIESLEAQGLLKPGATIVEPTSGNTGIALAFVAAAKGYKLILVMPESMSIERRKMLLLLGAKLELTPAEKGMRGAVARAQEIIEATPGSVMPQQFENAANPLIHRVSTAEEIWNDTAGAVDAVVSGVGTGGTISGVGQVLKARKPGAEDGRRRAGSLAGAVGRRARPAQDPGHRRRLRAGHPGSRRDRRHRPGVERRRLRHGPRSASVEGLPVGISSGAALTAAFDLALRDEYAGKLIVAIIPSFAERYLSTALFEGL